MIRSSSAGLLRRQFSETAVPPFLFFEAVDIVLEPGQISLHDVYLYHGSEANKSDKPRRGMTLRYMPTTSVYRHS